MFLDPTESIVVVVGQSFAVAFVQAMACPVRCREPLESLPFGPEWPPSDAFRVFHSPLIGPQGLDPRNSAESSERIRALQRDDPVATGAKSVCPSGRPINHSSKSGFRDAFRGRSEPGLVPEGVEPSGIVVLTTWRPSKPLVGAAESAVAPSFQSLVVGVPRSVGAGRRNSAAHPAKVRPFVFPWLGALRVVRFSFAEALAVGQSVGGTNSVARSRRPTCLFTPFAACRAADSAILGFGPRSSPLPGVAQSFGRSNLRTASSSGNVCFTPSASMPVSDRPRQHRPPFGVVGVGHSDREDEESLALVRGADFLRCEETKRRCFVMADHPVAERLDILKDFPQAEGDVSGDVLEEAQSGLDFVNERGDPGPQVSLVCGALAGAGHRKGLAGVSPNDAIHSATPRSAVEGFEIVPHRSPIQCLVFHPRHESGRSVGFALDVHHSAGSGDGEMDGEVEPPNS